MRMQQLKSFIRACELGSITRAAAELNVAQPALGLQIRNLEVDFGDRLIVRNVRGVAPTAAGELVLAWARDVLSSTEQVRRQIKSMGASMPSALTLGLTCGLTDQMPSMLVREVSQQLSGLELRIIEGFSHDVVKLLSRDQIDLGLTFDAEAPPGFEVTPLLSERLCYISANSGETGPIELADVLSRPLTLPGSPSSVREAVEVAARQIGLDVHCRYELNSIQTAKDLASCGLSGTILPFGGIHSCIGSPDISVRLIVSPMIERTLYLLRPLHRPASEIEQSLCRIINQTLKAMVRQNRNARQFWIVPDPFDQAA